MTKVERMELRAIEAETMVQAFAGLHARSLIALIGLVKAVELLDDVPHALAMQVEVAKAAIANGTGATQ